MERTVLKGLDNILPTCLTMSGRKKLGLCPGKPLQDTMATVVQTPKNVLGQVDITSICSGKVNALPACPENDRSTGPPGTPLKPSGQITKPGQDRKNVQDMSGVF